MHNQIDVFSDYFYRKPRDTLVVEGETAQLSCEVVEDAMTSIWLKDGEVILKSSKTSLTTIGKLHKLTIHNTEMCDEGQYTVNVNDRKRISDLEVKGINLFEVIQG